MNKRRMVLSLAAGLCGVALWTPALQVRADDTGGTNAAPPTHSDSHAEHERFHGHHGPKDPAHFIQRFDANGDGKLTLAELPEHMRAFMASADTNSDGVLSVEELTAHFQAAKQARFARADKNGDGAITQDEVGPRMWEHLKKADADGNGRVTLDELKAAHASGALDDPESDSSHAPSAGNAAPSN